MNNDMSKTKMYLFYLFVYLFDFPVWNMQNNGKISLLCIE